MKKIIVLGLILMIGPFTLAQKLEKNIDQIFNDWNKTDHPGGVVHIQKKGEILFSKAYGKANLKYGVPNNLETVFNIGSVSKQFTAMGIVVLQQQNKLSFDDDVRKYLPELHEFEQIITIRHLLHHTSGFRSTPELFGLAGWREGDAITTEDNYRYFCQQTSLNFKPGEEFMYSNSNYVLLAMIIEKVSQEPYNVWMKDHIFLPLSMSNTFIDETNSNSLSEVAEPYMEVEGGRFVSGKNYSLDIGASNIYTSASDLTTWLSNFQAPAKGWEDEFKLLLTTDTLNDGTMNSYALGVVVDDFYGNQQIQHSGGVPGFLSYSEYYPEEELTVVVLTNFTSYSVPQKRMELLQLLLKNKSPKKEKAASIKSIPLDTNYAKSVEGNYYNINDNYSRSIYLENDTLWYLRSNGVQSPLVQVNDSTYVMGGIQAKVTVRFGSSGGTMNMYVKDGETKESVFEFYDNTPPTLDGLLSYTGVYYSPELETSYTITIEEGKLLGYHSRHGNFPIEVLGKGLTNWSGMAVVKYQFDEKGVVMGFYVTMNRVRNVWFEKRN